MYFALEGGGGLECNELLQIVCHVCVHDCVPVAAHAVFPQFGCSCPE